MEKNHLHGKNGKAYTEGKNKILTSHNMNIKVIILRDMNPCTMKNERQKAQLSEEHNYK